MLLNTAMGDRFLTELLRLCWLLHYAFRMLVRLFFGVRLFIIMFDMFYVTVSSPSFSAESDCLMRILIGTGLPSVSTDSLFSSY